MSEKGIKCFDKYWTTDIGGYRLLVRHSDNIDTEIFEQIIAIDRGYLKPKRRRRRA